LVLNNSDILTGLGQFARNLLNDLTSGLLFFGGPLDIIVAIFDILATALVVFYVLKILRDSRAWQLLKGLALIIGFALACSLAGLTTVGFLLNNTISVLAIAFVVIFQPELRRALETFGRSSFSMLSSAISPEEAELTTRTAHHLIERQTKLSDLIEQENVVLLDAAVSATMLQQIFYKNSPLHDGAVLIRDGRITAARVHVPLSDNYHLRKDYGTRHRAAIGASEIGDTIAIVVSEERGSIGLTLDGRLYILDNADALRTLLHKLLSPPKHGVTWGGLFRGRNKEGASESARGTNAPGDKKVEKPTSGKSDKSASGKPGPSVPTAAGATGLRSSRNRMPRMQRIMLSLASLAVAIILWLYVQVTVNPVDTRSFTIPLSYRGIETAQSKGLDLQIPIDTVQISLMGRRKSITNLQTSDISAYIDFSTVSQTGLTSLPVEVDLYFSFDDHRKCLHPASWAMINR
jgi:diadenylate cyclase